MKLGEIPVTGVQPMGEGLGEVMAETRERGTALARAFETVGEGLSNFGFEAVRTITQMQHARAATNLAIGLADAENQLKNKTAYSTQEVVDGYGGMESVPEEIRSQLHSISYDEQGNQVQTERNDIPSFLVNKDFYQKAAGRIAEMAGQEISMPGWRNRFLAAAQDDVNKGTASIVNHSRDQVTSWAAARSTVDIGRLMDAGASNPKLFDRAIDLAQTIPGMSAADKETYIDKLQHIAQTAPIDKVREGDDPKQMRELAQGLKSDQPSVALKDNRGVDQEYKFSLLSEVQRRQAVIGLERRAKLLEDAEAARAHQELIQREGTIAQQLYEAEKQGVSAVKGVQIPSAYLRYQRDAIEPLVSLQERMLKRMADKKPKDKEDSQFLAMMNTAMMDLRAGREVSVESAPGAKLDPMAVNPWRAYSTGKINYAHAKQLADEQDSYRQGKFDTKDLKEQSIESMHQRGSDYLRSLKFSPDDIAGKNSGTAGQVMDARDSLQTMFDNKLEEVNAHRPKGARQVYLTNDQMDQVVDEAKRSGRVPGMLWGTNLKDIKSIEEGYATPMVRLGMNPADAVERWHSPAGGFPAWKNLKDPVISAHDKFAPDQSLTPREVIKTISDIQNKARTTPALQGLLNDPEGLAAKYFDMKKKGQL